MVIRRIIIIVLSIQDGDSPSSQKYLTFYENIYHIYHLPLFIGHVIVIDGMIDVIDEGRKPSAIGSRDSLRWMKQC